MAGTRLHFDCFSGLAGDMFLGACLDLGLPFEALEDAVARLGLEGVTVEQREAERGGIRGIRFRVLLDGRPVEGPDPEEVRSREDSRSAAPAGESGHDAHGRDHAHADHSHAEHSHAGHSHGEESHGEHRPLSEIRRVLEKSGLAPAVKERSLGLFARLAEAESRIHRVPIDEVHFHELGSVDAMVDLVGAATAWEQLAPESATCGPINVGGGAARTAHGLLPVPAPATAELLRGLPIYGSGESELLTPTGAVLLAELVDRATGELPRLVLDGVGYGLGKRDTPGRPNAFRLLRGADPVGEGEIVALECTIDDVAGEALGYLMERLLEGPAIDVFFVPAQMKKNRPGTLVTVLVRRPELEAAAELLLAESGALGCRYYPVGRFEAERKTTTVTTEFGEVRIKEGRFNGRRIALTPEYEDCRRLAREKQVPLQEVYRAALAAAANGERAGKHHSLAMWRLALICCFTAVLGSPLALGAAAIGPTGAEPEPRAQTGSRTFRVAARDGISIAVECAGSGPTLLMVHGGIGDRSRWTPMFPLLADRFTACAMDRRGHGESGDSPKYSLDQEAQDIRDVVEALDGPVFVLGHSYGGVAALEAAAMSAGKIDRLVLYEPPVLEPSDPAMIEKIERLIAAGRREEAALTFWREVVKLTEAELDAMRARPSWPALVADIDSHPRQMRALAAYSFDAERMRSLATSTLLLLGGETKSPALKRAIEVLDGALPHSTVVVLEGQEHNAMDRDREQLARVLVTHLLAQ